MIILNRNVTHKGSPLYAGDDVTDKDKEFVDDLLENGWADDIEAELQSEETETDSDEADSDSEETEIDLDSMTKAQLKDLAVEMQIEGADQMNKNDLIKAIIAADEEGGED